LESSTKGIDVARKNPVGKLAETALSTLKAPKAAAEKVVDQAKGTVALGRTVAETAGSVAGSVVSKAAGRARPAEEPTTEARRPTSTSRAGLRAVPEVNEPAHTQPSAKRSADSPKKHGDVLDTPSKAKKAKKAKKDAPKESAAGKRASVKAPAKTTTKKAPAKKAPVKKATGDAAPTPTRVPTEPDVAAKKAAEQARAKTTPAKKATTKKSSAKTAPTKNVTATPADVADVVEQSGPASTGAAPAKKTTGTSATSKKTAAKTSSPGAKLPARPAPAKEAPAKEAPAKKAPAKEAPPSKAAEAPTSDGDDVTTPAGTTAASAGTNPDTGDTGLTQPGTEPLVDPATVKSVASESEQLRQAAENARVTGRR
jgi:hypothetical protein